MPSSKLITYRWLRLAYATAKEDAAVSTAVKVRNMVRGVPLL